MLQLSENVKNPLGKFLPTLNYRLSLTASLSAHQPANPPNHQPSLIRLLPFPLKTLLPAAPTPAPPCSFQLIFAILRLKQAQCVHSLSDLWMWMCSFCRQMCCVLNKHIIDQKCNFACTMFAKLQNFASSHLYNFKFCIF